MFKVRFVVAIVIDVAAINIFVHCLLVTVCVFIFSFYTQEWNFELLSHIYLAMVDDVKDYYRGVAQI